LESTASGLIAVKTALPVNNYGGEVVLLVKYTSIVQNLRPRRDICLHNLSRWFVLCTVLVFYWAAGGVVAYAAEVNGRVVEGQLDRIWEQTNAVSERLEDEMKARFWPIMAFTTDVQEQQEVYLTLSQSIHSGKNEDDLVW
jgi:hypothetical protein